MIDYRK
jgi:hypothetical protein